MTKQSVWGDGGLNHAKPSHHQVSAPACTAGVQRGQTSVGRVLQSVFPSRLHASSTVCTARSTAVLSNRLSRDRAVSRRILRATAGSRTTARTALYYSPKSRAAALKKGAFDGLLGNIFQRVARAGLLPDKPAGSIDSTGLESHYVSRYFLKRRSRLKQYRPWIKVTLVCEHSTHLVAAAVVNLAPTNDAAHFCDAVVDAVQHIPFSTLSADGAYDSEVFHALCREHLGIHSTAIPINTRGLKNPVRTGRYRRQMQKSFPKRMFGQRWQVESTISQLKRHLGSALTAKSHAGRVHEVFLRVLVHNLMILKRCA